MPADILKSFHGRLPPFHFFKINSSILEDSQANLKCDKRIFLCYGKFEHLIFTTNEVKLY